MECFDLSSVPRFLGQCELTFGVTARDAVHQVDPSAQAVVGGMLDSGAIGLDLAEQYLAAIGPMDAVGYHPYLYNVATMEQDTLALRTWLDANGRAAVPIDINEFDAPVGVSDWGEQTAQYTQWALCTPALHVEDVQAYWWGATPMADTDPWFAMVNSELLETSLGTAYLSEVQTLTSQGCPAIRPSGAATTKPIGVGHPADVARRVGSHRHAVLTRSGLALTLGRSRLR